MEFTKENRILLAVIVVALNLLISAIFPPNGILLTPIVLSIIAIQICIKIEDLGPLAKVALLSTFISVHDIGLKLFAGGIHDAPGQGFLSFFLFAGLIPSFFVLWVGFAKDKDASYASKWVAALVFVIWISVHLYFFGNLGVEKSF